jgi:hypothetical protein
LHLLACAGLFVPGPVDGPTAEDYARDVRLEVAWADTRAVLKNPMLPPPVAASLVNISTSRSYPVVHAGGGSRRGPVEPSMHWSLERLAPDGTWSTWDSGVRGIRADSIGTDWRKSIVSLAPLETLELRLSDLFFNIALSHSPAGVYRARAHYEFSASDEAPPSALVGIPAYELVSSPVEFEYAPPFTIEIDAVRTWSVAESASVGALIDARLVNRGESTLTIPRPASSSRTAIVRSFPSARKGELSIDWPVFSETETSVEERALRIAPGASVAVFGPDGLYPADEFHLTWADSSELPQVTPPIGIVVRVRVEEDRAPLSISSEPIAIPLVD